MNATRKTTQAAANRELCEQLGDDTQKAWEDAPQWQVVSAINGVRFHLENPDATPANSHESWLAQKEADGWKYGPVKNEETKEHPCFVPYAELPPEQQAKDHLFRSIVHAFRPFIKAQIAELEAEFAEASA